MWRRKMLQFTAGALLLLLPWFGGLASGEIIARFSGCLNFFYKQTPPKGFEGVSICQRYDNTYHFATLYDRKHRTALYSAYLLSPLDGKRPKVHRWMYEPQLVSSKGNPGMEPFPDRTENERLIRSQAVPEDYVDGYTKGHLAPSQHLNTTEDRKASFTLTNIVPQMPDSNNGTWSKLEGEVLKRFKDYCNGTMYVITGTVPYKSVRMLNERVSIPEYIWSAYCCPSLKSKLPENETTHFPTYAALGSNDPNKGYAVRKMPLKKLEKILDKRLKTTVSLFHDHCPASKP